MKTAETVALEKAIRRATYKMGTFGCYEVTIGYGGRERVDYMTYDTKGIFRCYEVKVSKADFHSSVGGRSTEVSTPWEDMLKESMIRSLYRDSDKLILTEDEQYIGRLKREIDNVRRERDRETRRYTKLWKTLVKEFGYDRTAELLEKAEE